VTAYPREKGFDLLLPVTLETTLGGASLAVTGMDQPGPHLTGLKFVTGEHPNGVITQANDYQGDQKITLQQGPQRDNLVYGKRSLYSDRKGWKDQDAV